MSSAPQLRLVGSSGEEELLDPHNSAVHGAIPPFEEVVRRYAPYVAGLARRLLGPDAEVDDVVQLVFMDAFRGLGRLRNPGALRGWLATTTVRRVRKHQRHRSLRRFLGLEQASEVPARGSSPERKAMLADVYRALDALPPAMRIAWILSEVEGEGLTQVAALCGCSRATAHRRIVAARERLQLELGDGR